MLNALFTISALYAIDIKIRVGICHVIGISKRFLDLSIIGIDINTGIIEDIKIDWKLITISINLEKLSIINDFFTNFLMQQLDPI